jgi:hypothetical protein
MSLSEIMAHPATLPAVFTSLGAIAAAVIKAWVDRKVVTTQAQGKDSETQATMRKGDLEILHASERVYRETILKDLDATKQRLSAAEKENEQCQRNTVRLESSLYRTRINYSILKRACERAHTELKRLNPAFEPLDIPDDDPDKEL